MKKYNSILLILLLQSLMVIITNAQTNFKIGICKDATSREFEEFSKLLQKEIMALTKPRVSVIFEEVNAKLQTI